MSFSFSNDLTGQLRWNSASGVGRFFVLTVVYFVTYPYMLRVLGAERFGMWSLALAVTQTLTVQDLGVCGALMKSVPEYWHRQSAEGVSELASTALLTLGAIGAVLAGVAVLARHWIVKLLNIPVPLRPEMEWILVGMAGVFFLNLLCSGLAAVLNGIQRMDASNLVYTLAAFINGGGVFLVLARGYGLKGLVLNAGLMSIAWGIGALILLYRLIPSFRLGVGLVRRSHLRSLLGYGAPLQAAGLAGFITPPIAKFLLSRYVSLPAVASFEFASGMAMQLRSVFVQPAIPLVAASAQMHAAGDIGDIERLYRVSMRLLVLVALPVYCLGILLSPAFVRVWLHAEHSMVAGALQLLLVGWLFNTLTLPAYFILQGRGLARYQMRFALLQAGATALLGYVLVQRLGYYGAIMGMTAGLFLAAVYILWRYQALSRGRAPLERSSNFRVVGMNAALLATFWMIPGVREARHLFSLMALAVAYLATYMLLLVFFGRLSHEERHFLTRVRQRLSLARHSSGDAACAGRNPGGTEPSSAVQTVATDPSHFE